MAVLPANAVSAPAGFPEFCLQSPDQCRAAPGAPLRISLDKKTFAVLAQVNDATNRAIAPEDERDHYGRINYWTIPTDGRGDCKSYVLAKRKALIEDGFPEPALRIAVVITPLLLRHAVLTVATDQGDLVLDNLRDDIRRMENSGYAWVKRQDPSMPSGWASLE
jgi:predicted transglutaminase-like cysteine proteinase